jgi:hypothetical protein
LPHQTAWRGKPPKGLVIGFWQSHDKSPEAIELRAALFFHCLDLY